MKSLKIVGENVVDVILLLQTFPIILSLVVGPKTKFLVWLLSTRHLGGSVNIVDSTTFIVSTTIVMAGVTKLRHSIAGMAPFFFASPIDVDTKLSNEEARKSVELQEEKEKVMSFPIYYDRDSVGGQASGCFLNAFLLIIIVLCRSSFANHLCSWPQENNSWGRKCRIRGQYWSLGPANDASMCSESCVYGLMRFFESRWRCILVNYMYVGSPVRSGSLYAVRLLPAPEHCCSV